MNTIREWADRYVQKRLWVYPYNMDEKQWLYWKNIKTNDDYTNVFNSWNWEESIGIKLVVGKKGTRVIEVSTVKLLKKALALLKLPKDYSWVIYSKSGYGIIVDTPSVSAVIKGMDNRSYKQILVLWEGYYVLPCVGIPRYFYNNRMPLGHPKQVSDEIFMKCINSLCF